MRSGERRGDLPSPDAAFLGSGIIGCKDFDILNVVVFVVGLSREGRMMESSGRRADHQRYYLDVLYQMPFFVSRSLPLHLSDALGNLPSKRIT
jgi:hypothetical protein